MTRSGIKEMDMRKAKPVWKQNWFWFVGMPTLLVAAPFVLAFIVRGLS